MSYFSRENEFINIPSDFIRLYLKETNGAYIKVYLYMLLLATNGAEKTYKEIAHELDLIETDVLNALQYWKERGVINEEEDRIIINDGIRKQIKYSTNESVNKKQTHENSAAEQIAGNRELSEMASLAQDIFGRILTKAEMESLFWFYDGLKFSPEAILLLLEYCVSKGKTTMSYIEKVAVAWAQRGAHEADSVYEIMKEDEQKNNYLYSIKKIMGIADRALSQSEEKYIIKWKNDYGMNEDMIALAYDYCMLQTAKLSLPYMDKIIQRWNERGIKTVEEAKTDNKNFKERKTNDKNKTAGYTDLENLTRGRMNNKNGDV